MSAYWTRISLDSNVNKGYSQEEMTLLLCLSSFLRTEIIFHPRGRILKIQEANNSEVQAFHERHKIQNVPLYSRLSKQLAPLRRGGSDPLRCLHIGQRALEMQLLWAVTRARVNFQWRSCLNSPVLLKVIPKISLAHQVGIISGVCCQGLYL